MATAYPCLCPVPASAPGTRTSTSANARANISRSILLLMLMQVWLIWPLAVWVASAYPCLCSDPASAPGTKYQVY